MQNVFIVDAVRTPRGRGKPRTGALREVHPQQLLAQTLSQLTARNAFDQTLVDDVVIGCVSQVGEQGACIARSAVLAADWPYQVTGCTVNRFCGSGLQAINFAAFGIQSGQQQLTVGGGVESMSRVPMGSDSEWLDANNLALRKKIMMVPQGISADLIATIEGFSRADVDAFALASQQKTARAVADNRFAKSLFAVKNDAGEVLLELDEHPRPNTTLEALAGLRAAFEQLGAAALGPNGETVDALALKVYPDVAAIQHVHTGGNSSGIVDGAAVVLLASGDFVKAHGLKPRARVVATATAGAEPVIMLTAPAPASERALKRAGMKVDDIDLWEINEAFACVPMLTMRRLDIDPARVNVNGGAIALGHPLGATGACLLGTALDELERSDKQTALVTLCIGGGMGIGTIIERV